MRQCVSEACFVCIVVSVVKRHTQEKNVPDVRCGNPLALAWYQHQSKTDMDGRQVFVVKEVTLASDGFAFELLYWLARVLYCRKRRLPMVEAVRCVDGGAMK